MRWSSMHLGSGFFFWGRVGGCWIFVILSLFLWNSHCVPIKFPMSSQKQGKNSQHGAITFLHSPFLWGAHIRTPIIIYSTLPPQSIHFHLFIHDLLPTSVGWVNLLPTGIWQWLVNVFNYSFNFSTQLINIYDLPYLYFTQLTYIWGLPLPKRGWLFWQG
jgi:hypothetical protein